jgi:hypothetical protein
VYILFLLAVPLVYSRAFQVLVFLGIAGARKLFTNTDAPKLAPLVDEWGAIAPPIRPRRPSGSRCGITYHHWYHAFRPKEANACLAAIADLGAGYLRADIRWKDILPDGKHLDADAVNWYRAYLIAAREWYGLTPHVVLSTPPSAVTRLGKDELITAWHHYLEIVIDNFGDLCESYQLMNEINSPVFRFVSPTSLIDALTTGADIIRRRLPGAELSVNVLAGLWGWKNDLRRYRKELRSVVDVIGIDFYPATWSIALGDPWAQIETGVIEEWSTGEQLPRLAVTETGYATNIPMVRSEPQQSAYFLRLQSVIQKLEKQLTPRSLAFIMLYEICDEDTSMVLDPEAHFGLIKSGSLNPKCGYAVVQDFCRILAEPGVSPRTPKTHPTPSGGGAPAPCET